MSNPEPNIQIRVDLTNPGQFFACCGMLELASRLDDNAHGYFVKSNFCLDTSATDVLDKFFKCPIEVDTTFQSSEIDDGEEDEVEDGEDQRRGRIYPMKLAEPFNLLLNWWTDEEAQGQKLKLWSAGQRVTDILLGHHKKKKKRKKGQPDRIERLYTPSTKEHFADVVRNHPDDWLRKAVPIESPAAFSFDSRLSRNNALDLGHFADGTLAFSPAIDVLCLIGFQRFRPEMIETWNRNRYCTWNQPLPVIVAAPSAFQLGGIEALGGICRDASLNLCTLRDIESTKPENTLKLQRYILGLSLVAITYLDGKALNLRQGCQLVAVSDKPMRRVTINADGTDKEFAIDAKSALAYASEVAADFGIGPDRTDVTFDVKAAKAARKAAKKDKDKEEDKS